MGVILHRQTSLSLYARTDGGLHGFIQREAFQQGITDFSIGFFCRIIQAFDTFGGFSQISGGIGGFAGYVGVGILEQGGAGQVFNSPLAPSCAKPTDAQ